MPTTPFPTPPPTTTATPPTTPYPILPPTTTTTTTAPPTTLNNIMLKIKASSDISFFLKASDKLEAKKTLDIKDSFSVKTISNDDLISSTYTILSGDDSKSLAYTGSNPISAIVTSNVNLEDFNTSIMQLSSGAITYITDGVDITSFGDLRETAGKGATSFLLRYDDDKFILTGTLQ